MGVRVALMMILMAFASGTFLSATQGPLRQIRTTTEVSTVIQTSTQTVTLTSTVRSQAQILVSPTAVKIGQAVRIDGKGFSPNAEITITVNGVIRWTVKSDPTGAFVATVVPEVRPGVYTITASDQSGNSDSHMFTAV